MCDTNLHYKDICSKMHSGGSQMMSSCKCTIDINYQYYVRYCMAEGWPMVMYFSQVEYYRQQTHAMHSNPQRKELKEALRSLLVGI